MAGFEHTSGFELIYAVVGYGMGSKLMHKAKDYGLRGGTILPAKGTVQNAILNFFSLYDERKELVLMGTDSQTAGRVMAKLAEDFHFEKPNKGIAFSTPMRAIIGCSQMAEQAEREEREEKAMYELITAIVNRGKAEEVMDAAKAAGSKGGTILNGRGSGVHETVKLFHMEIEPEKEIVLILSVKEAVENIVESIRKSLEIDKPGNGIIFIQEVSRAYGVYRD